VIKVYAAVISADPTIERTNGCAVIAPRDVSPWLVSLPPQRSLTESRRERMLEMVSEAV
jgi:hypothetical protein